MRVFLDSNVLVYALGNDDAARRDTARRLIAHHGARRELVLSPQVLLETFNVLTRKKGVAPADALVALRLLARHEVEAPGGEVALLALELAAQHRLNIWDAFIVQCALEAGCDTLFSEDLQAGRRFGALEVVNPFSLQVQEAEQVQAAPPRTRSARSAGTSSKTRPSSRAR